jgi:hypothetical protein
MLFTLIVYSAVRMSHSPLNRFVHGKERLDLVLKLGVSIDVLPAKRRAFRYTTCLELECIQMNTIILASAPA